MTMTDPHLDPQGISALASGRLSGAARDQAVAHIETCRACRDDLTYVVGFERRARRKRTAVLVAGLASVALVVSIVPRDGLAPPSDTLRAVSEEGIPLIASFEPENGAELTGDSARFVWQNVGTGTHYRLHVSAADGTPLLERAVRDTVLYLPLASPLKAGQSYFWFVDALLDDGGAARSNVWRFTVRE